MLLSTPACIPVRTTCFDTLSFENRLHLQSKEPDLLIEFDLPPGTHATIGASPQSEITLLLTGIPPFICILRRFQDGRVFLAELDGSVARRVDLPEILSFPPYQMVLYHHSAESETLAEPTTEDIMPGGKSRHQIAGRIRSLFRMNPQPAPAKETSEVTESPPSDPAL